MPIIPAALLVIPAHRIPDNFRGVRPLFQLGWSAMNGKKKVLHVVAISLAGHDLVDFEDSGVTGVYSVSVPYTLGETIWANVALDIFHTNVAVGNLDNFWFVVYDPETGVVLEEAPGVQPYSHAHECKDFFKVLAETPKVFLVKGQLEYLNGAVLDFDDVRVVATCAFDAKALAAMHFAAGESKEGSFSCEATELTFA